MDLDGALKHIRRAWIAGLISAGITLLVVLVSLSGSRLFADLGFGWWELLDVALALALSYGIYRKSRIAAILMLASFIFGRFYVWVTLGQPVGWPVSLILGYFFVQGVRGTFAYHSMMPESSPVAGVPGGPSPPQKPGAKRIWWVLGGAFVVGAVVLLGLLVYIGTVGPDIKVLPGPQVPKRFVEKIDKLAVLEPDEQIRFFYSDALVDIEEGFYLLTDRKVVVYSNRFVEPAILVPFEEIESVEIAYDDSFWTDSQITLYLSDATYVYFPVSSEVGGDKLFHKALTESIEAAEPADE